MYISKRLCDSSANLIIFLLSQFGKCLTLAGALAKPTCKNINDFFFPIAVLKQNSPCRVYLRQHFVSVEIQPVIAPVKFEVKKIQDKLVEAKPAVAENI